MTSYYVAEKLSSIQRQQMEKASRHFWKLSKVAQSEADKVGKPLAEKLERGPGSVEAEVIKQSNQHAAAEAEVIKQTNQHAANGPVKEPA